MQPHPILEVLPQFDVVSFDVFDTLLLRPFTKPTDLFEKLERDFKAKGFARARTRAERNAHSKARASGRIEATFDEIYAEIPRYAEMAERETTAEMSYWTVNPEMLNVWRAAKEAGKKVIVASDMYLPRPLLEHELRKHGYEGWDGFYLSNDIQAQKASGTIYDRIIADFAVPPDKILHVGDNRVSDVIRANEKGIIAFEYPKVFDQFLEECPFVQSFLGNKPTLEKRLLAGTVALGWHLYKFEHPEWTYWNRIGYLFAGPLGCAFMHFVGDDARRRGINHLLFVARDGYILQQIFDAIHPKGFKTDYFHLSRDQALLASQYFGQTAGGIERRRIRCLELLAEHGIAVSGLEKERYLSEGKLPVAAAAAWTNASQRMKSESAEYLSGFGIKEGKTAVVDGNSTHFTAQHFIDAVTGHKVFGYYLFSLSEPENGKSFCRSNEYLRFLAMTEFLFCAPTPPLKTIENGRPVHQTGICFFERFKIGKCNEMASAAVSSAVFLRKNSTAPNAEECLDWFEAFMDRQTTEDREHMSLARNSFAISHDGEYVPVIDSCTRQVASYAGIPVIVMHLVRHRFKMFRILYLFGRIPIMKASRKNWERIVYHFNLKIN